MYCIRQCVQHILTTQQILVPASLHLLKSKLKEQVGRIEDMQPCTFPNVDINVSTENGNLEAWQSTTEDSSHGYSHEWE